MRGKRLVIGAVVACLAALIMTGGLTAAFTLRGTSDERPPGAQAALAVSDVGSATTGPEASPLLTAVPKLVNFQGRLTNPATGQPVPDGSYSVTFRIFGAASGGTQLWSETQPAVAVTNGLFNVLLGSVSSLAASVFDGDPRYLEVQVGADPPMTPRQRFSSVPYAYFADGAGLLDGKDSTDFAQLDAQDDIQIDSGVGHDWEVGALSVLGIGRLFIRDVTTGADRLTIDQTTGDITATNKVGIGVTPTYKVDVVGDLIRLRDSSAAGAKAIMLRTDGRVVDLAATNADLLVSSSTANTIIQPWAGNVGIGTETPARKLDVVGDALFSGQVGIGTTPTEKLTVRGNVLLLSASTGAEVVELGEGLDYAEGFDVSACQEVGPGTVLIIDPDNPGNLTMSTEPYDTRVAGVVSGANGLGSGVRLGGEQFDYDVALAGRVYVNVDGTYGEVSPGDLLTTSPTPGYAMVVKDHSRSQGAILGKAMEELEQGERGQILVLVTLQ